MKLLEINNLEKSFDELSVIKDISFDVNEGEVVSIIGPSGSGKSTLLRCATLLEMVTSGDILFKGEYMVSTKDDITTYASKEDLKRIRAYFGLVFQNYNLFPHMSVINNIIEAPIAVMKRSKSEAVEIAQELLNKVGLSDKGDAYPCELSGGQQQRVAIARALAMQPDILFFDEPTSALDPELIGEILKVIRDLASEKMTMVIVTHEMAFARDVADKIIFMDGGVIVESGKAADVINNPQMERTKAFLSRFN